MPHFQLSEELADVFGRYLLFDVWTLNTISLAVKLI